MIHHIKNFRFITALLFALQSPLALADQQRFEAADSEGVQATRGDDAVHLQIDAAVTGPVTIPRLAAPLRTMHWQGGETQDGLSLKPEQDTWVISWKNRPEGAATLVLQFDAAPWLPAEVKPIEASGDGSFYIPAHLAMIDGEKIRYEPQPFKNTVGYWVGKNDTATWTINLDKPGRFNVAVLQGCGKGQGGSEATMAFSSLGRQIPPAIDFEVVETGHFQNFQWVQLSDVELLDVGLVEVKVLPKQIKKAALMDIRAIHLIRLPDKK